MRLQQINSILKRELPNLTAKSAKSNNESIRITEFGQIKGALDRIEETGMFSKEISMIRMHDYIILSIEPNIMLHSSTYLGFNEALNNLKSCMTQFNNAMTYVLHDFDEVVSVQLPQSCSIKEVAESMTQLDKSLSMIINRNLDLVGFDKGSLWLDLNLYEGIAIFYVVVGGYYNIRKKQIEFEKSRLSLENMKLNHELAKTVFDSLKDQIDAYKTEILAQIVKECPSKEPEVISKLEKGSRLLWDLLDKGYVVQPEKLEEADSFIESNLKRIKEVKKLGSGDQAGS